MTWWTIACCGAAPDIQCPNLSDESRSPTTFCWHDLAPVVWLSAIYPERMKVVTVCIDLFDQCPMEPISHVPYLEVLLRARLEETLLCQP